jgi:hypothetical protein
MGIEPTLSAWKAEVLPLNYTRIMKIYYVDPPLCLFSTVVLRIHFLKYFFSAPAWDFSWSGRQDLNLRPPGPKPGALPS